MNRKGGENDPWEDGINQKKKLAACGSRGYHTAVLLLWLIDFGYFRGINLRAPPRSTRIGRCTTARCTSVPTPDAFGAEKADKDILRIPGTSI